MNRDPHVVWLTATDPRKMLELLGEQPDERKLRLFACACVRQVERLLFDPISREAVATAERYAADTVSLSELLARGDRAEEVANQLATRLSDTDFQMGIAAAQDAGLSAAFAAFNSTLTSALRAADYCAANAASAVFHAASADAGLSAARQRALAREEQCWLLREIHGDPWMEVPVRPEWLTWNDCTVQRLAQGIYNERAYDRLPVLADALEDAGCTPVAGTQACLLAHCRTRERHAHGCWAVTACLRW